MWGREREREFAVENKLTASERAIGSIPSKEDRLVRLGRKQKTNPLVKDEFFYSLPFSNQFLPKEVFKESEFLSDKNIS